MYDPIILIFTTRIINGIYSYVSGLVCTPAIARYGTGPCVIVGCLIGCTGFLFSSLAGSVPVIIVCTGVVAGR